MTIDRFNSFLGIANKAAKTTARRHFVVGNESADLDSVVSALIYSYYRTQINIHGDTAVIPVINISAEELRYRPEVIFLLSRVGVELAHFVYRDALAQHSPRDKAPPGITLVDHNQLPPHQTHLEGQVQGVIDHHADSGAFPQADPRIITPVGSTATLIARQILATHADLLDAHLAQLLLGPILLDTVNLDSQINRAKEEDRRMAAHLSARCTGAPDALYEALVAARRDVAHFTPQALLARDLKQGRCRQWRYAISAVPIKSAAWYRQSPDLPGAIIDFARKRDLDLLVVLTYQADLTIEREILAWSPHAGIAPKLYPFLNSRNARLAPGHPLRIQDSQTIAECPIDNHKEDAIYIWRQQNTQMTRKHLLPLIDTFLQNV